MADTSQPSSNSIIAPNLPVPVNPVNQEQMYDQVSPSVEAGLYQSQLVRPPVPPPLPNSEEYQKQIAEKTTDGQEFGQSGTLIFQGIITLEEYNEHLQGFQAFDVYDEMRRSDGTVQAALKACKLPLISTDWRIEPASQEKKDLEVQEFISNQLFKQINWKKSLREMLLEFDFGFSVAELVYKTVTLNGKSYIGLKKLASRKPRTIFSWVTQGNQQGVTQIVPSGGTLSIPREKLLIVTHEQEGDNYIGISLLRAAYKHWYLKKGAEIIDSINNERMGAGIPLIEAPDTASAQDKAAAREAASNLRTNEQAYIEQPTGWKIGFMDLKNGTPKDILPSIQYHDHEILLSVLAQFLDLGSKNSRGGSHALSADHSQFFIQALEYEAENIAESIQKDVIEPLVRINFGDSVVAPTLKYAPLGSPDIQGISTAVDLFVRNGTINPDFSDEQYFRTLLSLPLHDEDQRAVAEFKQKLSDLITGMGTVAQAVPPPPAANGQPPNEPDPDDPANENEDYSQDVDEYDEEDSEATTASEPSQPMINKTNTPPINAPQEAGNPVKAELRNYIRSVQIEIAKRETSGDEITKEEIDQMSVELLEAIQKAELESDKQIPEQKNDSSGLDQALQTATELLNQANDYAKHSAENRTAGKNNR